MKIFNFNEYKEKALQTCQSQCLNEKYLKFGLISEVGEIAGKLKRVIRDGIEIDVDDMIKELGDVLWYATVLNHFRKNPTNYIDKDFEAIYFPNITSVSDRFFILNSCADGFIKRDPDYSFLDIVCCLNRIAKSIGSNIQEVAYANNKKLADRKIRDKINGSGDDR